MASLHLRSLTLQSLLRCQCCQVLEATPNAFNADWPKQAVQGSAGCKLTKQLAQATSLKAVRELVMCSVLHSMHWSVSIAQHFRSQMHHGLSVAQGANRSRLSQAYNFRVHQVL